MGGADPKRWQVYRRRRKEAYGFWAVRYPGKVRRKGLESLKVGENVKVMKGRRARGVRNVGSRGRVSPMHMQRGS